MGNDLQDKLSPEHRKMLTEGSGISDEIIEQRGYRTITDPKELMDLGFDRKQTVNIPGLLLPVHCTDGANGLYTYRPDIPRVFEDRRSKRDQNGHYKTKLIKYEMPKNARMRLDCPVPCRRLLADSDTPLWITEGQKKADALATHKLCAIALLGVWNFKGRNEFGGVTWLADWDYVNTKNREIRIVFDSDVMVKPEVRQALDRLIEHLQRKGAHVLAVYLPQEGGHKVGVDDYLLAHTLEQLEGLVEGPRLKIGCADPVIELLDFEPTTIRRPMSLVEHIDEKGNKATRAYAAIWPNAKVTVSEAVDKQTGNIIKYDPPLVTTQKVLCLVRDDGVVFGREVDGRLIGDKDLAEIDTVVTLNEVPAPDRLWSIPAMKAYRKGYRPDPVDLFTRLTDVVDRLIDFDRSLADQRTMSELIACWILHTWFLDAFNVASYLWPNGERGSGKTQLLMLVASLSHLGLAILSGGSYAALRDLADYGATLAFDDCESLADPNNKNNEEKRALLLAGNRRGTFVTMKEVGADQKWHTRYVDNFAPRIFSAIRIPDPVLASRTIIVPLVKTADSGRGNTDALDYSEWPHKKETLTDDCWALSLANMNVLREYESRVGQEAELTGRNLEPWRAPLALALWLTDRGATGLWKRIHQVSLGYHNERSDIESEDLTRWVIQGLLQCLVDRGCDVVTTCDVSPEGIPHVFKTRTITEAVKEIVEKDDLGYDLERINSRRIGHILKRLRIKSHREPGTGQRGWILSRAELEKYVVAFGVIPPEKTSQVVTTSQTPPSRFEF